MVRFAKRFLKV